MTVGGLDAADFDPLRGVAEQVGAVEMSALIWQLKFALVAFFVTNAFLKFVWAHRVFGYGTVMMAAVPNDPDDPQAYPRATQSADICITAARSFNRALRATYFALASIAWILGPVALILSSIVTFGVLYRREFASHSRTVIMTAPPNTES